MMDGLVALAVSDRMEREGAEVLSWSVGLEFLRDLYGLLVVLAHGVANVFDHPVHRSLGRVNIAEARADRPARRSRNF